MPPEDLERKLTAILSADVVGYSRLMREDDAATVRTLTGYREIMTALIKEHRGRVVDSPGDNLLAEFCSVIHAVNCAVEMQRQLKESNAERSEDGRPDQDYCPVNRCLHRTSRLVGLIRPGSQGYICLTR